MEFRHDYTTLVLHGVEIPVTRLQAEALLVATLPPEEIVYTINTEEGGLRLPDWSVKRRARCMTVGEVFFERYSEALKKLFWMLSQEIAKTEAHYQQRITALRARLADIQDD